MSADITEQEKNRLGKLLNDLEVSELYIPEKCMPLVREFREKYKDEAADLAKECEEDKADEEFKNPYRVDESVLDELNKKILNVTDKRRKLTPKALSIDADPKRPWRLNTPSEQLLRIDAELRSHASKTALEPTLPSGEISRLLVDLREAIKGDELVEGGTESRNSDADV